jgi:hypothetical protein
LKKQQTVTTTFPQIKKKNYPERHLCVEKEGMSREKRTYGSPIIHRTSLKMSSNFNHLREYRQYNILAKIILQTQMFGMSISDKALLMKIHDKTHLKRDVHGEKAILIHAPASTLQSPSWYTVSFIASLK